MRQHATTTTETIRPRARLQRGRLQSGMKRSRLVRACVGHLPVFGYLVIDAGWHVDEIQILLVASTRLNEGAHELSPHVRHTLARRKCTRSSRRARGRLRSRNRYGLYGPARATKSCGARRLRGNPQCGGSGAGLAVRLQNAGKGVSSSRMPSISCDFRTRSIMSAAAEVQKSLAQMVCP
jgi:hypothetical protein